MCDQAVYPKILQYYVHCIIYLNFSLYETARNLEEYCKNNTDLDIVAIHLNKDSCIFAPFLTNKIVRKYTIRKSDFIVENGFRQKIVLMERTPWL